MLDVNLIALGPDPTIGFSVRIYLLASLLVRLCDTSCLALLAPHSIALTVFSQTQHAHLIVSSPSHAANLWFILVYGRWFMVFPAKQDG